MVTSPVDASAIGSDLDLDLLGIAGREGCFASRANGLFGGQCTEILDDGQVAVVASFWTGSIAGLAPLGRCRRRRIGRVFEVIGTVGRGGFFGLASEELILELAVLAANLLEFGFEFLGPRDGPGMLSLPIADLLSQFGVLTAESDDFLTEVAHFAKELANQFGKFSRLGGRKCFDKRALREVNVCTQDRAFNPEGSRSEKTGWAKVY